MVRVAAVKLNQNQTAISIRWLSHPEQRMYQTVKAAAVGESSPEARQSQSLQQLNSVSTDYANLCNLWITTSSCQATLSQLPSDRACCHLSHNSAAAFLPSKFHLPVSTRLPATPERALKNLAARGKQPHTEESSDGHLQAAPARAS